MIRLRAIILASALACALALPAAAGQHDAPQLRTDGGGAPDLLGDTMPGQAGTPLNWRQCNWAAGTCTALPTFLNNVAFAPGNLTGGLTASVSMASLNTQMFGWGPTAGGIAWQSQFHPDYGVLQSTLPYNETELQVYTNAANGIAQVVAGTNQVVLQTGTAFSASWVGVPYFYFEGINYKVASVTDASHLTVTTLTGGSVSFGATASGTYYFGAVSATNTCQVNGNTVTTVPNVGTPFFGASNEILFVNGVLYPGTISGGYNNSSIALTGPSLGTIANATCTLWGDIDHQLAAIRLQGLQGASEENFTLSDHADGTYIGPQYAGAAPYAGKYRPVYYTMGEYPAGTKDYGVTLTPNPTLGQGGDVAIAGPAGSALIEANEQAQATTIRGTLSLSRANSQEIRFNGLGTSSWRGISTVSGSTAGDFILQYSGDGFVSDFHTALTLKANGAVTMPLATPASSSAPCTAGQFEDDASNHYVCVATNTWKRAALSSF